MSFIFNYEIGLNGWFGDYGHKMHNIWPEYIRKRKGEGKGKDKGGKRKGKGEKGERENLPKTILHLPLAFPIPFFPLSFTREPITGRNRKSAL